MTGANVALVTGTSSGIGRATALELHRRGFVVYATARDIAGVDDLAALGIKTVALNVTDEESVLSVVRAIEKEQGAVDVLVNNAGFELVGPVEEVPIDEVRKLFDTNVFGLMRLTQLVLPGMRDRRRGRIINVASIYGRLAVPGGAFYGASKHAVEGFSEALRLEIERYGIDVTLVEPAATRTRLRANTVWFGDREDGPYAPFHQDLERWRAATYETRSNPAGRLSSTPEQVAEVIAQAATGKRPRARYPVGIIAHALFAMRRLLPATAFEAFVRRQFATPRPAGSA
jgi:NAD(P)-dependent dehydrogenase (short-subunit alcohol dehydrogenase family)